MRRFAQVLLVSLVLWPSVAAPQTWQQLDGAGIRLALAGQRLVYDNGAWQEFRPSGRTLYNAGADSWGYWRVEGGQYCSQWPPSDLWACYDVFRSGSSVRFSDKTDNSTDGVFVE